MAVEEAIDEMQVAWPATARAHREFARQMSLGACGESGNLLVPDMDPIDLALPANRVGQTVEAIANDSVYSLYARRG
jgi:hypothetical protein